MYQAINNATPEAYVTRKKSRSKIYHYNNLFFNDEETFEIELFNPKTNRVLTKIWLNGQEISGSGIIINPGQRIFLERFIDSNNKFVYKTYDIENNTQTLEAIRSNGDIEYDWTLDNDWDHDSNKIPLRTSFMYAILCQHKNSDTSDTRICSRLPNEIWEYIYTISLEKYRENINLTLNQYNKIKNSMEPCIRVKKGGIYKRVSIDLI
jgi:hypothetical protein